MNAVNIWCILTIAFILIEIATINLVSIWFAIASAITVVFAMFDVNITVQIVIFLFTSLIGVIIYYFVLKDKINITPTNNDTLIGQKAIVTEEINPLENTGRVTVLGQDWKATGSTPIQINEKVIIENIRGVTLHVTKMEVLGEMEEKK